jgi:protein gp37
MASNTNIEWADSTFNPWLGCTKVGPGCDHCYAEVSTPARTRGIQWGPGAARQRTSAENWKLPVRWNAEPLLTCDCGYRGTLRQMTTNSIHACGENFRKVRRRVFCASLADWLDNDVPIEWLVDLLGLIRLTPNLDWLLLTKRIGNWRDRLDKAADDAAARSNDTLSCWILDWLRGNPPANVWLLATVVNQPEADRDVVKLLNTPARVRGLSIEPILGPINLERYFEQYPDRNGVRVVQNNEGLDWIIVGGESGSHARPMHPHWIRSLRDQCAAAGASFMFKQWGEYAPVAHCPETCKREPTAVHLDGHVEVVPSEAFRHLALRSSGWAGMCRVGKKGASNMLDGHQHLEWPA